ncbi:MAG: hypothetical protein JNL11_06010 [Bdellovibrionaceae bacterium]|nr:hypothetical protein [Pseudobdellovibrionaceae bacterium]
MTHIFSTVYGIFKTRNETQDAMDSIVDEGFDATEISILFPENASPQNNLTTTSSDLLSSRSINETLGLMDNPRTLHIPGYGPLIAAGPAMEFLDKANSGDTGWLKQPLINRGIPEYEAKRYENNVDESGFLLAIDCRDSIKKQCAQSVLSRHGARYVAATSEMNSTPDSPQVWQPNSCTLSTQTRWFYK